MSTVLVESSSAATSPVMLGARVRKAWPVLVNGFSVSGTQPHESQGGVQCWTPPVDHPECGREDLRHTRLSSWVRYALRQATLDLQMPDATRIGLVSASRYGCVGATNETRRAHRQGGILGVDPVRFSKATHVYPLAVNAMEFGWRGPVTAFVGHDDATWQAMLFASQQIQHEVADAMCVVAYEEIDDAVLRHLQYTGYLDRQRALGRIVAENVSVVVLARQGVFGKAACKVQLYRADCDEDADIGASGSLTETLPADVGIDAYDVLGATLVRDLVSRCEQGVTAGGLRIDAAHPFWRMQLSPCPESRKT
jgi:hypothetical protein